MNSSVIQLADLALVWDNTRGCADLAMIDSDLASDRDLQTAVVLSLFTDRRAHSDDVPPSGDARDMRGWWADAFADVQGDLYGSRNWLLDRSVMNNESVLRATEFDREALQWMLDDKVVSAIDVTVTQTSTGVLHAIHLTKPSGDRTTFKFSRVFDHILEDG